MQDNKLSYEYSKKMFETYCWINQMQKAKILNFQDHSIYDSLLDKTMDDIFEPKVELIEDFPLDLSLKTSMDNSFLENLSKNMKPLDLTIDSTYDYNTMNNNDIKRFSIINNGDKELFCCTFCDRKFDNVEEFQIHYRSEHRHINKLFACQICGKKFANKYSIRRHHKTTHTFNNEKCEYCEKVFKNEVHLKRHVRTIHLNPKIFKCTFCDKTYTRKASCKKHEEKCGKVNFQIKCEKDDYIED